MKEYDVVLSETAYGYLTVEARSESEARQLAMNSADVDWADPHGCAIVSVKQVEG
jgi:hypothetical protein